MRVYALNHSDEVGGAARAAYRIHHAVRSAGVDSTLLVNQKSSGDLTVKGPQTTVDSVVNKLSSGTAQLLKKALKTKPYLYHSLATMPTQVSQRLNQAPIDAVHLHWVQGEMLSVADVAKIKKPLIWTLHDMWAFSGAEHYPEDERWISGYATSNRPDFESGLDLNRWTWARKEKLWKKPISIVTPSLWLAECVKKSLLMKDWPVRVIPNPIDTQKWVPIHQSVARQLLGLPEGVPLILFGAIGGGQDPRKGFDLAVKALQILRDSTPEMELVIFGETQPKEAFDYGFLTHYMGHIRDDVTLQRLYSAADVMLVPSRQEAFGQTASEALACGCPVAAFDVTGLKDVVSHMKTGYLAKPFDVEDLAKGINWLLNEQIASSALRDASRKRAESLFDSRVVAAQYIQAYQDAMEMDPR